MPSVGDNLFGMPKEEPFSNQVCLAQEVGGSSRNSSYQCHRGNQPLECGGDISEGELQMFTVRSVSSVKMKEQTVTLKLRPKCYIKFQIDSGADCNILPLHVYGAATGDEKLENVSPSDSMLYRYGQVGTKSVGKVIIPVNRGDCKCAQSCELVDGTQFHSILGSKASTGLGIIEG